MKGIEKIFLQIAREFTLESIATDFELYKQSEKFDIYLFSGNSMFAANDCIELAMLRGVSVPHFHLEQDATFVFPDVGVVGEVHLGKWTHEEDKKVARLRVRNPILNKSFKIMKGIGHAAGPAVKGQTVPALILNEKSARTRDNSGYPEDTFFFDRILYLN